MATALPKWNGTSWGIGRDQKAQLVYLVSYNPATEGITEIESAILAAAPAEFGVGNPHVLSHIALTEETGTTVKAICSYDSARPKEDTSGAAEPEFSFEIASQQVRIAASLSVVSSGTASGKTIPDNGNLIGVKPDGTVEGIEVPQMTYSFSEVHHFAMVDTTYKNTLAGLVGTVNNGNFRGFAAGEVLSTGVSGSKRGKELWQVRFQWAVIKNTSGLTVGPISGINKDGWDYIEWFTQEKVNTTNKKIERELCGYRVHRVLRRTSYASFGIGT